MTEKKQCSCGNVAIKDGWCADCLAGIEEARYEEWERQKFAERSR